MRIAWMTLPIVLATCAAAAADMTNEDFDDMKGVVVIMCHQKPGVPCVPCEAFEPEFDAVAASMPGMRFRKAYVKLDKLKEYDVKLVPAILFFKDGELVGRHEGGLKKEDLKEWLRKKA